MKHGDVVAKDRRLSNDDAGGMVHKCAVANPCIRVDVHLKLLRNLRLQKVGQWPPVLFPQPMCDSIALEGMKTLVVQKGVNESRTRRVSLHDRKQVVPNGLFDLLILHAFFYELHQECIRHGRPCELVCEMKSQCILQALLVQNRRKQERGEKRLVIRREHGLLLHVRPELIIHSIVTHAKLIQPLSHEPHVLHCAWDVRPGTHPHARGRPAAARPASAAHRRGERSHLVAPLTTPCYLSSFVLKQLTVPT
mmetsp:Transcript_13128/g.40413  ORF Transcript_13128/g.40413 Transcript_13128/m.40413 type:complete len:251 (-) Transcript_13128:41-793(-)